jgi:hypothetical protein
LGVKSELPFLPQRAAGVALALFVPSPGGDTGLLIFLDASVLDATHPMAGRMPTPRALLDVSVLDATHPLGKHSVTVATVLSLIPIYVKQK